MSDEAGRLVFREGLLVQVGRPARVFRAANCTTGTCCYNMGSRLGVCCTVFLLEGDRSRQVQYLCSHLHCMLQAVRKGHWIVLDELNLAPTEVLEALNRQGRRVSWC